MTLFHDHDSVGHCHGFDLVMGHVDHRPVEPFVQDRQFSPHGRTQLGIEVRQRLIEQETVRIAHDGTSHGDTLTLPSGQVLGLAFQILRQFQHLGRGSDPARDLFLRRTRQPQSKGHVSSYIHMRVERIGLEHHGDVALLGSSPSDVLARNPDHAASHRLKPRDHPERS